MRSSASIKALVREAADRNYRHRLATGLLQALGCRADNNDLCVPLAQPIDAGNIAAVNAWLSENPPASEQNAHRSALSELQRHLTVWEHDQWD